MRCSELAGPVPRLWGILVPLALVGACGEGSFSPTIDAVSGPYTATVFTLTQGGQTQDLLGAGASLSLTLLGDGTTEGRLFVPGQAEDGGDVDLSLAGTWSLERNQVTLQHEADTFLRDISLTASERQLEGEFVSGDQSVRVRLAKPDTND